MRLFIALVGFAWLTGIACTSSPSGTPSGGHPPVSDSGAVGITDAGDDSTTVADSADAMDRLEASIGPSDADAAAIGCSDLPPRDCVEAASVCASVTRFDPASTSTYDDYPVTDETAENQYRSFARTDVVMLVKWAAAFTACKAAGLTSGNGGPIGLGDMSEQTGAIPGTAQGDPGYPPGSHENGFDIDTAYYQIGTENNRLRPVCPHRVDGNDEGHCVSAPTNLDVERTALFIGALLTSARVRVIGVDGKIGPVVKAAIERLCSSSTLQASACADWQRLAYEETDTGRGWYRFHHHHMHIATRR